MRNLGILTLDPASTEKICNGEQICFLSEIQIGEIGDLFSLNYENKNYNFKIIDIWNAPQDFVVKFMWRLCGLSDPSELYELLKKINANTIYIHIFYPTPWNKIKKMVIS